MRINNNYNTQNTSNVNISFGDLKEITPKAYKIGGDALRQAESRLKEIFNADLDCEIIPRAGIFTKIRALIIFVSKKGENKGSWSSLAEDPKGYTSNDGYRYFTIEEFSAEKLVEIAEQTKARLLKHKSQLPKVFLPADMALLGKILPKPKSCMIG